MTERKSTPSQRTFGRGMVEGLKLAGVTNPGEVMNHARIKALEQGLNGLSRKVYDLIPIETAVSVNLLVGRAAEKGCNWDARTVKSVIGDLLDRGLVRSAGVDKVQRVAPRVHAETENTAKVLDLPVKQAMNPNDPGNRMTPLERLADLEARVRAWGTKVQVEAQAFAEEIAAVAIVVEEDVQTIRSDNAKFARLKEALRDLVP